MATLGPFRHMDPASQSRSCLLAMVEFIILTLSSFVSHSLRSRSSLSCMSMMSSIVCIRERAVSVRCTLSSYCSLVALPASCSQRASSRAAS